MKKIVSFALGLLLLSGCAPTLYYTQPGTPKPSILDFPMTELVSRLVIARGPYKDFNYIVQPIGENGTETLYTYSIESVGGLVGVAFNTKDVTSSDWTFSIQKPNVKIEDLFKSEDLKRSDLSDAERTVFNVVSGPFKGVCASQFLDGFWNRGDKMILIEGDTVNSKSECTPK